MLGISIVICCHNGASRLPATLSHLCSQKRPQVPWEVLLVDNGSTDGTAEVARSCWENNTVPLRVVHEPSLGVRFARERGLAEAIYPFVGFVDDDNWLANDWVGVAYEIISSDLNLGAVGSIRTPACEGFLPAWFENFHSPYAILTDADLETQGPFEYLPTAGLCIRKGAWETLNQKGFHFKLTGRMGKKLTGGEDAELTMALRLSGWKLRVDHRLRLQHFLPNQRLQWTYLRRLLRNYGQSQVFLDAYTEHSLSLRPGIRSWLSDRWWYQLLKSLTGVARRPLVVLAAISSRGEGKREIVELEQQLGRIRGLFEVSRHYGEFRREIRNASWRE